LGNAYARQARWSEAQQAYFSAHGGDSAHPDYAYNLAISLDHLQQGRLALEFYRRALQLAGQRPAAFERARAEQRIGELAPLHGD